MISRSGALFLGLVASQMLVSQIHAQGQVFLTQSLPDWQNMAGNYLNVTDGYGVRVTKVGSGSMQVSDQFQVVTAGVDWDNWCCGYVGQAIWTTPVYTEAEIRLNGLTAFGVQVEPDPTETDNFTATLSNGQQIHFSATGNGGAQFVGFVGSGITSIKIRDDDGQDFAFGNIYAVSDLMIMSPVDGANYTLDQNYIATDPIPFEATSGDQDTMLDWSNLLEYTTSGGRGGFKSTLPFNTMSGQEQDETYTSMGGQLTSTVTQDSSKQKVTITITGVAIPTSVISNELAALYAGGYTPNLLEQIATYESSYQQFYTEELYNVVALWPHESYDGGSHIGLMQVGTTQGGFGDSFDWTQNAQAGAALFINGLQIAKSHLNKIVKANPGLPKPTPAMLEDESLSFYNVGTKYDYWTVVIGQKGTPQWQENTSGDPIGTAYADCVRQQTPPNHTNCQ